MEITPRAIKTPFTSFLGGLHVAIEGKGLEFRQGKGHCVQGLGRKRTAQVESTPRTIKTISNCFRGTARGVRWSNERSYIHQDANKGHRRTKNIKPHLTLF